MRCENHLAPPWHKGTPYMVIQFYCCCCYYDFYYRTKTIVRITVSVMTLTYKAGSLEAIPWLLGFSLMLGPRQPWYMQGMHQTH